MQTPDWITTMFHTQVDLFSKTLRSKSVSTSITKLIIQLTQRREKQARFVTLDLGCGIGRLMPQLSSQSTLVVGLDNSSPLLQIAANDLHHIPNVVFVNGDFRNLDSLFAYGSFDFIIRAYTSLGYFPYAVEEDILKKCHAISSNNAFMLVDTFNSKYFRTIGSFERSTEIEQYPSLIVLIEKYSWNEDQQGIDCNWVYENNQVQLCEINFFLHGYDHDRVNDLLLSSGWNKLMVGADFDQLSNESSDTISSERLVVIATRIS